MKDLRNYLQSSLNTVIYRDKNEREKNTRNVFKKSSNISQKLLPTYDCNYDYYYDENIIPHNSYIQNSVTYYYK